MHHFGALGSGHFGGGAVCRRVLWAWVEIEGIIYFVDRAGRPVGGFPRDRG